MADEWGTETADAEAGFEFDTEGVSGEDLGGSGDIVKKEGWYHWDIADVKNELETLSNSGKDRSPCITLRMLVLEGVEGQSPANSVLFHRIYMAGKGGAPISDGAKKSALRFGLGAGILKEIVNEDTGESKIVDAATNSTKIGVSTFHRLKGKQVIAQVKLEKGEGSYEDKYAIPFGRCYQPNDPQVAEVPMNKDALASIGIEVAAKAPPQKQEEKKAKSPPPPAKTTTAPPPKKPANDLPGDLAGL
jgi:hypothetical protein